MTIFHVFSTSIAHSLISIFENESNIFNEINIFDKCSNIPIEYQIITKVFI